MLDELMSGNLRTLNVPTSLGGSQIDYIQKLTLTAVSVMYSVTYSLI
jgi:hypothetical protein